MTWLLMSTATMLPKTILPNVAKDNKDDLTGTDTGVLTQVFVNDDEKKAVVYRDQHLSGHR